MEPQQKKRPGLQLVGGIVLGFLIAATLALAVKLSASAPRDRARPVPSEIRERSPSRLPTGMTENPPPANRRLQRLARDAGP